MTKSNSHINTNRLDFFFVVLTDNNVVIVTLNKHVIVINYISQKDSLLVC